MFFGSKYKSIGIAVSEHSEKTWLKIGVINCQVIFLQRMRIFSLFLNLFTREN